MKAILGRKVGMTQVFTNDGKMIPVTVVEVLPNVVLQKKTKENDGYEALQLGYEDKRANLANKADLGHLAKANTAPKRFIKEVKGDEMTSYNVGDEIKVDLFKAGELVDVIAKSKGKGFSGMHQMKNYSLGPMGHGSGYHRGIGSIATMGLTNNRIHPGTILPGHFGFDQRTVLNLTVVSVDAEKNAILIKGAIPGANRSLVTIRSAVKFTKNVKPASELVNYNK